MARFCSTRRDGPTPQAIANLIIVCSLAGPARPIWTGSAIPSAASRSAQAMMGPASKANCVAMAMRASVRSAKACFQRSAAITAASPPPGSMSRLPSG